MFRAFFILLLALASSNALHFYLESDETKCFIEELPSDTTVEGHYRALEFDKVSNTYAMNKDLGIDVEVTEAHSGHQVVKTRGPSDGRFTFTSHDAGDHHICFTTNYTQSMFSSTSHIKFYLDLVVGSTKPDTEKDRTHVTEVVQKLRDLNTKLEEIKREQQYQREREHDFRDLSEATNSRAVWYTIFQICVLVGTCYWQLRHLRIFFREQLR